MAIRMVLPLSIVLGLAVILGQIAATEGKAAELLGNTDGGDTSAATREARLDTVPENVGDSHPVVIERYPDGRVKIERQVALDEGENFVNHGVYRVYAPNGRVIGTGQYHLGKKDGEWTREFRTTESQVIGENATKRFTAPFTSNVTFRDDQLHGDWTISDSKNRPLVFWQFSEGRPQGQWVSFNADGTTRKQIPFQNGQITGDIVATGADGKLKVLTRYIDGRELFRDVSWYSRGRKKKSEGHTLKPREFAKLDIDWWNGSVERHIVKREGKPDRHGEWRFWHANGKLRMQGTYDQGKESGRFVWWHDNGQKLSEGQYIAAQMQGNWQTWHANGGRRSAGQYVDGQREGMWMSWHENGMPKFQAPYTGGSLLAQARKWDESGRRMRSNVAQATAPKEDGTIDHIRVSENKHNGEDAVSRQ